MALLASGTGSRFGSNKLLEPFGDRPLYMHAFDAVPKDAAERVVVVTAYDEVARSAEQYGFYVRHNDDPDLGQGRSIRIAMEALGDLDACIFCVCDQPYMCSSSLLRIIDEFRRQLKEAVDNGGKAAPIISMSFRERRGNPVLFSSEYFAELKSLDNHQTGSIVIRAHPENVSTIEAECDVELADVDNPEDSEELAGIKNCFLTGAIGSGKSTLLRRAFVEYDIAPTGILTLPYAIEGHHAGHYMHALSDLIAVKDNDKAISVYMAPGSCIPIPEVFEKFGVRYLRAAQDDSHPMVLLDELGQMEKDAWEFQKCVTDLLDSPKSVVGVLKDVRDVEWLEAIRERKDTRVVRVLEDRRGHAAQEFREFLEKWISRQ